MHVTKDTLGKKYNFFNGSKLNLNQKVFMYAEIFFFKQNNVYLDEENQCDIDYLIEYENLYDDLNILLDKLGLKKKKDIRNIVLNSSKFNNNMDENKQLHTIREMNTDSFNHILKCLIIMKGCIINLVMKNFMVKS